jgi:hypothetical protein
MRCRFDLSTYSRLAAGSRPRACRGGANSRRNAAEGETGLSKLSESLILSSLDALVMLSPFVKGLMCATLLHPGAFVIVGVDTRFSSPRSHRISLVRAGSARPTTRVFAVHAQPGCRSIGIRLSPGCYFGKRCFSPCGHDQQVRAPDTHIFKPLLCIYLWISLPCCRACR